ncbi:PorV/PorQ family protein [Parapedobacter composti]|nr:hypothetical protein [Parapedobacter composti]
MISRWPILLLISFGCNAQTYLGPRYQAMGHTGAALQGIYSLTANPAGLAGMDRPMATITHQYHFLTTDIATQQAMLGLPTRLGTFGVAASRYGIQQGYQELRGGFTLAKRFGPQFSVGLSTVFHQLFIPYYLTNRSFSVDLGVQYALEQGTAVGFQYTNIGSARYGQDIYGTIPAYAIFGISHPMGEVRLSADAAYRSEEEVLSGHLGLEYQIGTVLCLRGGLSVNPVLQHAGFGIVWRHFVFDAAATFHPRLGTSPQIGVCYAFR